MTNTVLPNTLENIPEMNLFTLRCYVNERTEQCTKKGVELEKWEDCIKKMLRISDKGNYSGSSNDEFHFLWETMMLSLLGRTDISLRDFYNCGCNGNEKNKWDNIV